MTAATQALSATAWKGANVMPMGKAVGQLHVHAFDAVTVATAAIDEANDIFELGYLPAGVVVHGFIVKATDMDTGGPALVWKLRINGVDVVTGLTSGQAGTTSTLYWCDPTTTAGIEVVDGKVTTQATTPAQGTVTVRVLYTSP
jgi:hypothetical protein